MNSQKIILSSLIIFVLVIAGAGIFIFQQNNNDELETTTASTQDVESNQDQSQFNDQTGNRPETTPGVFSEYDESLLASADSGDVVLFFQASWCVTCRSLERNILSEKDQIPADLTILTLDYDSEDELKEKYGVLVQHTLVQVDSDGELITKWVGGNTLETITDQVT